MVTSEASLGATTVQRIHAISTLYQQGMASEFMDRTLAKMLEIEAAQSRAQLEEVERDLAQLEKQYSLSSDEFGLRFLAGETDDRMDFVEWASLVQMRDGLRERLRIIAGEPGSAA